MHFSPLARGETAERRWIEETDRVPPRNAYSSRPIGTAWWIGRVLAASCRRLALQHLLLRSPLRSTWFSVNSFGMFKFLFVTTAVLLFRVRTSRHTSPDDDDVTLLLKSSSGRYGHKSSWTWCWIRTIINLSDFYATGLTGVCYPWYGIWYDVSLEWLHWLYRVVHNEIYRLFLNTGVKLAVKIQRSFYGGSGIIIGLLTPDSGSIKINSKSKNKFGVLFQNSALFDYVTVWENISFNYLLMKLLKA